MRVGGLPLQGGDMTYIALTGIVLALAACGAAFLVSDGSGISRPLTVLPGMRKRFGSVGLSLIHI